MVTSVFAFPSAQCERTSGLNYIFDSLLQDSDTAVLLGGLVGGILLIPSAAEGRDGQCRLKWQFPWLPCREMSLYISSDTSQNTQTQLILSP